MAGAGVVRGEGRVVKGWGVLKDDEGRGGDLHRLRAFLRAPYAVRVAVIQYDSC